MAAETDNGFLIDGKHYPMPGLDSLDMDERMVLYDYSGLTREDFLMGEDDDPDEFQREQTKRMRHPGLWKALLHVAYQRGNRDERPNRVKQIVGKVNINEATAHLFDVEEDDDSPPAPGGSTSDPSESSRNGSSENDSSEKQTSESSGDDSTNASDAPAAIPVPTGTTR